MYRLLRFIDRICQWTTVWKLVNFQDNCRRVWWCMSESDKGLRIRVKLSIRMCVVEDARFWLPLIGACIRLKEEFDHCSLGKRSFKVNEFVSEVPITHWNEMQVQRKVCYCKDSGNVWIDCLNSWKRRADYRGNKVPMNFFILSELIVKFWSVFVGRKRPEKPGLEPDDTKTIHPRFPKVCIRFRN